jgi:hypothetical protein
VSLHCENTSSCGDVDYGVSNDGTGNLAGYAWSENNGWISFSCADGGTCGDVSYGVTIDSGGEFQGFAWGENIGWISFNCDDTSSCGDVPFQVQTSDGDGDGCAGAEEAGPNHKFGGQRDPNNFWDYFDVTGDRFIDLSDALDVLGFFGDPGTSPAANLRDRDIGGPDFWNTVETDGGVDLTDALVSLLSFGDSCSGPP